MCVGLLLSYVSTEGRIWPRRGEGISYKLCLLCAQFSILLVEGGGVEHRIVAFEPRKRDKPVYVYKADRNHHHRC